MADGLRVVKPKLLIIELWGLGDLAIGTPFLRKACEHYEVTLLAKPFAADLRGRFWPDIEVIPFNAPWTAFKNKYRLHAWPWRALFSVWKQMLRKKFDVALSARWGDPRDHFLLKLSGAKERIGFPRMGSSVFLTQPLKQAGPLDHQYENWRIVARALNLELEPADEIAFPSRGGKRTILLHTGAAQPVRVWPLERFMHLTQRLRGQGYVVQVLCNPEQKTWWEKAGEREVVAPTTIAELLAYMDEAAVFLGNDSGPGHLAAFCGIPTFTFFGPQVPEWFKPLHPAAELIEGKACPYKPCKDYCRFPVPHCLWNINEDEVWPKLKKFLDRHVPPEPTGATLKQARFI
jgi:ADP-heptose:LPS heptosyltransferase